MEYKLYSLNAAQHIVGARDLIARDDLDALKEAGRFFNAPAMELWAGTRCVARLEKANPSPDISDQIAL
jgi:hypothetical protein